MGRSIYNVTTSSAVALTAATNRTILSVLAPSQFGTDLLSFWISFDGVSPTAVPVFWQLCSLTGATAGTSTSETSTIAQEGGRTITTGFTAASAYTVEPTVLTEIKSQLLTPNGGVYEYEYLWPDTPDSAVSQGFALRLNAPASGTNVRAGFRFARC